ncbi:MAG: glycogen-binding domain-containing protein [Candidatus Eisenbacteria bacterium]
MRSTLARTAVTLLALITAISAAEAGVEAVEGGIRFTYEDAYATRVSLAGVFNNWSATANPMTKEDGVWTITVALGPGKHEYKFVVDNQWIADPDNPVTAGEYGNSVVNVGPDGDIVAMAATSNTAYSAKILLGGRMISRFISRQNSGRGDRYELERPTMDLDLDWKIRANDYLDLHMITTINNENEEAVTDFWKTSLHFDRGSVLFHKNEFRLLMFDNESAGVFDDPLRLVGDIGIYHHDFGFRQQGARADYSWKGVDMALLYSDDFQNGGTFGSTVDSLGVVSIGAVFDSAKSTYRIWRSEVANYQVSDTDNDKDVLAFRAKLPAIRDIRVGTSWRFDRGYNPGFLSTIEADGEDSTMTRGVYRLFGETWERWWGGGADLAAGGLEKPWSLRAEVLVGRAEIDAMAGGEMDVLVETAVTYDTLEVTARDTLVDTLYMPVLTGVSDPRQIDDRSFDVDRSERYLLGGDIRLDGLGMKLSADWERETHEQGFYATGLWDTLENSLDIYRLGVSKRVESFLGRPWGLALETEVYDFDYDPETPWRNQFWFDTRNFWLEQSEHEVSVDRMVLLGGRNASFVKPVLTTTLWAAHDLEFTWRGNFAGVDLDKDPKYTENLFQLEARPWKKVRLYSDTRLVKYNDPVLAIFGSWWSTFAEAAYEVAEGIEVSLSYGVDPFIVDETTNEFDAIGRDLFLFERGANGDVARRSFSGLGTAIPEAEQALEDERRIQIEGIVRF